MCLSKRRDGGEEGAASADKGARMTATLIMSHIHLAFFYKQSAVGGDCRETKTKGHMQEEMWSRRPQVAHNARKMTLSLKPIVGGGVIFKCFHCPTIKIKMATGKPRVCNSSVRKIIG